MTSLQIEPSSVSPTRLVGRPGETIGSLPECLAYLQKEMEQPPALVTLKKWSAAGVLDAAKRYLPPDIRGRSPGQRKGAHGKKKDASAGRARYALHAVLAIAQERLQHTLSNGAQPASVRCRPTSASSPRQQDDGLTAERMDELATKLSKSIIDAVAAAGVARQEASSQGSAAGPSAPSRDLAPDLLELLSKTTDAIASLESTRRAMMLKYDAELQMWKQKCADLQAQLAALKAQASQLDVMKTNVLLNNILDKLNSSPT